MISPPDLPRPGTAALDRRLRSCRKRVPLKRKFKRVVRCSASAPRITRDVTSSQTEEPTTSTIQFTTPSAADGQHLHKLVHRCEPVAGNSIYGNLLHCSHFAQTSVAAWMNGTMVGFVSGYIIPDQTDSYFLWQVTVDESARGRGLAKRMIRHILQRPRLSDVHFLDTTITADNEASWALFRSLAKDLDTDWQASVHSTHDGQSGGAQDDEHLLHLGPFQIDHQDTSNHVSS